MKRFQKIAAGLAAISLGTVLAWGGTLSSAQASNAQNAQNDEKAGASASAADPAPVDRTEAAVPPPSELAVLQFNICGSADHCPDTDGVVAALLESIEGRDTAERPDMISLNEVCGDQFGELETELGELGYAGAAFGNNLTTGCDGAGFGNAVFTTDPIEHTRNMQLPNPAGAGEERGLLCASTMFYVGCSTHVSPESLNHGAQVGAVAFAAEQILQEGYRVVVAGDLNIEPDNSALNMLYEDCYPDGYGRFGEGDADPYCSRSGDGTFENGSKIDYIFFDTENFRDFEGDVTNAPSSDHQLLWATAQLR